MSPENRSIPILLKVLIAGGFGVGKTTMVGAVSEIAPLKTEEYLTSVSSRTDSLAGVESKTMTTVLMDFGRITLDVPLEMVIYLFGTPGQSRFFFSMNELSAGAIGAVVLADTRRLGDSFAVVNYFEKKGLPFVVAVNQFDGSHRYKPEEVRTALELPDTLPVLLCDARDTQSAADVLIALVKYALSFVRTRRWFNSGENACLSTQNPASISSPRIMSSTNGKTC